ncbi:metallophosphoesterase [uncultured Bartonella sp.]|uniref:metallophosphoesterase family protein n=1 Tax=uncultured Bartonella sp. TaxID=104108 RepID=UPI0026256AD0|nr:metallophosphoesterase [uncultured Bartonella sp.]
MFCGMFQLAHISDIHLSPLPEPRLFELLGKRITGYINWKKNRTAEMGRQTLDTLMESIKQKKPGHLVITGDLVNLALTREFSAAKDWLVAQGPARDISLTFGNHDAYVRGAFKKACKTFRPWMTSEEAHAWSSPFPYMRVRGQVAIIAVSSAIATPPFFATGRFDSAQAHHLADLLQEAKERNLFRVVMIHHPPYQRATYWYKKLWGIERFQRVIKQLGTELILHGHTHVPSLEHIEGKLRDVPVVGVASASQAFGGKKPPANYNWLSIDGDCESWHCELERYTIINRQNDINCTEKITLF